MIINDRHVMTFDGKSYTVDDSCGHVMFTSSTPTLGNISLITSPTRRVANAPTTYNLIVNEENLEISPLNEVLICLIYFYSFPFNVPNIKDFFFKSFK